MVVSSPNLVMLSFNLLERKLLYKILNVSTKSRQTCPGRDLVTKIPVVLNQEQDKKFFILLLCQLVLTGSGRVHGLASFIIYSSSADSYIFVFLMTSVPLCRVPDIWSNTIGRSKYITRKKINHTFVPSQP